MKLRIYKIADSSSTATKLLIWFLGRHKCAWCAGYGHIIGDMETNNAPILLIGSKMWFATDNWPQYGAMSGGFFV